MFRVVYFNIPLTIILILFLNFALINLGWFIRTPSDIIWVLKLNYWLAPYLLSQYLSLQISDGMHLILDTEFAKNRLYTPITHHKEEL